MAQFLDLRTSQNASYANSIAIPILVVDTPQLVGQVGLNTGNAGANIRVELQGTIAVQLPLALVSITISVVRGTLPTDPEIFSASQSFSLEVLAPQVISFNASDFDPPAADQLTYTMFVSSSLLGTIRVGPESFSGIAVSD
ncbi:hypothetical protein ACFFJY_15915 [Fictibacillus aquaticus]|uniref:Exosporium protein C n=1 Tax=Fictibacillus aquaticus TaxID=2021314 RepID=A0A235FFZ7_9BACL|nr:hypothetical protein [Fictibacillus aquaticus]OYD59857.1 hypothetical protein CGZ90_07315 [Fictibacillus aquaticus]